MAVYGYIRLSVARKDKNNPDAPQDSVEVQRAKIEGRASMDGWTVARYFEDPDVSGGTALADRQSGGELLKTLQPGDVVIAARLDRMFRDAADALVTLRDTIKPQGIKLVLLDIGNESVTENGTSKMLFQLLSLFAEWEKDRIGARIRDNKKHLRADGRYLGGPVPFGFRLVERAGEKRLEPDANQQAAIALIHSLEGRMSLRKIAAEVKAKHRVSLSAAMVQRILGNGERVQAVKKAGTGALTRDEAKKIQADMTKRGHNATEIAEELKRRGWHGR
jgi:DNA invertase Pin-like site-specific DNA recombinase